MTKQQARSLPGNDGSWFLDLVNAQRSTERSTPTPAAGAPAEAAPQAATSREPARQAASTTETVERMWQDRTQQPLTPGVTTGRGEPFDDWKPTELARAITSRRNFRWPVIAGLIVLGAIIAAVVVWVPTIAERIADDRAAEYGASLSEIRTRLPETQSVLGAATDLTQEVPVNAAAVIADLASAAENSSELAARALPSTPPLVPRGAIEELRPYREQLGDAASDALQLTARIDAIVRYREAAETILVLPPLPEVADAGGANELSVELASLLADASRVNANLPADSTVQDHRAVVDAVIARLGSWQVEYLDALRREDTAATTALIEEAAEWQGNLDEALRQAMGSARIELDQELVRLARTIEQDITELPL